MALVDEQGRSQPRPLSPDEQKATGVTYTTTGGGEDKFLPDPVLEWILKLQDWGISPTDPSIKPILRQAANNGWTAARIELEIRNTQAYQDTFQGKPSYMSETEWLGQQAQGKTAQTKDLGAYRALLKSWNLPIDDKFMGIAKAARENNWSADQFKLALSRTTEYKQRFGGKPRDMSEETYISTEATYHSIAEQLGINLGEGPDGPLGKKRPEQGWRIKYLFQNAVSPEEFRQKGEAMAFIRDNQDLFHQFAIELANRGLLGRLQSGAPKPLTPQTLLPFVFGQGEAQWHETWQNTIADYAAEQAGIAIRQGTGLYTGLSRQEIHRIADKNLTQQQLEAGFNTVADEMLSTLPLSQARAYGLTKQDLIQAQFGGPNAAQARAKIARVKAEHEAFASDRAAQGVGQDNQGNINVQATLTARKGYAQSEA